MLAWLDKLLQGILVIVSYYFGRVDGRKETDLREAQLKADTGELITNDMKRIQDEDQAISSRYSKYRRKLRSKNNPSKS